MTDELILTFGDLGELFDGPHATPTRTNAGPYFLNISSLIDGRLDLGQSDHVSEEDFTKWTRRVTPQGGDLLFSYETRLGDAALMPAGLRACLGRRMALLRPDQDVVDPAFLLYYYVSPEFKELIATHTIHGATVNRIGLSTMGKWPVRIPSLPEQKAIAEVLGALDDKIAANTKLIADLEALSESVFLGMVKESRSIPLSQTAQFVNGKAFTKGASGTGRVVIRIAELNSGLGASTVYSDAQVDELYVADPGDLLFAWSGSLTVQRWFRPTGIINQHIFKVIPKDGFPMWLVAQALRRKLAFFQATAADKATTMGHIQRKHLDELVDVPNQAEIDSHSELMTSLWNRALLAEQESLSLATTRDTLLPQLMSGKLRVRDAESSLGKVV